MSLFQAGQVVVYGNLGVYEVENVGPMRFGDGPAKEYYTLRPCFSQSNDRSYIPTDKEGTVRAVISPERAKACLEQIGTEEPETPAINNQTMLAAHYQEKLHRNDFYETLKLFRELCRKEQLQKSRGRKVNGMDIHFTQLTERILSEELSAALGEPMEEADQRLRAAVTKQAAEKSNGKM